MKFIKAEYIISAAGPKQYPTEGLPEVAFAGRSNVGKSSLLNCMVNRKALARTSQRPGKTQLINFFQIEDNLLFVDLPGYGFAKVSKSIKETWGKMITSYLESREPLAAVAHLVDIRHEPTQDDVNMFQWLQHYQIPTIVVATKADKVSRSQYQKQIKLIKTKLGVTDQPIVLFSSETRQGREELWQLIAEAAGIEYEPEVEK